MGISGMYSPSQLHAYYREHFATQGFPALYMGKIFAVYIFFELIFLLSSDLKCPKVCKSQSKRIINWVWFIQKLYSSKNRSNEFLCHKNHH